jgi:hypothetical protein
LGHIILLLILIGIVIIILETIAKKCRSGAADHSSNPVPDDSDEDEEDEEEDPVRTYTVVYEDGTMEKVIANNAMVETGFINFEDEDNQDVLILSSAKILRITVKDE